MVKITIKTKDLPSSGSEESEGESEAEGSDAESTGSARSRNGNSLRKSGRSKRKCVVNFEKKKAKTLRPSKSRSKSVTPHEDEDEDEEDEMEERPQKEIFSCDICTKAFHSKFMMRTHVKAHKKIEENAKCDKYYHYYLNSIN